MKINFYSATSGKTKLVITLALVDGKIESKATNKEYVTMLNDILASSGLPKGKQPVSVKTPREFLASMPNTYLGSYFWAEVAK